MKTSDFDFELPKELIAQTPLEKRDSSRLMVINRNDNTIEDKMFTDIVDYFNSNDVLVLNDTKVIPARLIGTKSTGAVIEILLLKEIKKDIYECLVNPAKRIKVDTFVFFSDKLKAKCIEKKDEILVFQLIYDGILLEILDELGEMPLPPYIHEKLKDKDRYQTVYAKNIGSAAAPTAGLHFTNEIFSKLKEKNVKVCFITLHVGLGTFKPVKVDDVKTHKMHSEYYEISSETANILNNAKKNKNKIISVGTTTTRTLETVFNKFNEFKEDFGETDIFIYPGYKFLAIDSLITNFHLPKSTLIMLVSAFSSKELILESYKQAIKKQYRFFSFGDCMLIE